ncbi:MAG: hypothetical protein IJT44_06060 [Clostridia bacterium]|nr:hypothetical protein [Clostridia bacterium]
MKQFTRKCIALVLAAVMLCSATFGVSAASDAPLSGTKGQHLFDKVWDKVADGIVGGLARMLLTADSFGLIAKSRRFPTAEEYAQTEHPGFYPGTNGASTGEGWKLGYAGGSVIPTVWRRDASGAQSDTGMMLNKARYFGGYFGQKAHAVYDGEEVHLVVLSVGADRNGNGVEDILIYAVLDNIGMANGNVRDVRLAAEQALAKKGVDKDDIAAFEFGCTHAHTVIEALGMGLDSTILTGMKNHFFMKKDRAIEPELLASICAQTASCVVQAYEKMEAGTLYYFETENVNEYFRRNAVNPEADGTISDNIREKTKYGAANQGFFACWYFEGESGEKTILANTGVHPTFPGRRSDRVCADFPYYMRLAMREAGYNCIFIQGAQAAIGVGHAYTAAGEAWAKEKTLSYEDWVSRYGEKYAKARYNGNKDEDGEGEYFAMKAVGYDFAHLILASLDKKTAVDPVMDVRMGEILVPLDYSIMYIAAVSGVFGYNTVYDPAAETGYGIMSEVGYVALGSNVVMLMMPGEVSPALVYGTRPDYTGTDSWQGEGSWSGEEWKYKTIADAVKQALGDKRVLSMGLANDELGYIMPDTDTAKNFLTKSFIDGRQSNEELMGASQQVGSALVLGYGDFLSVDMEK